MGHLTFESKRLSAVGNKRILQFFDSAREPRSCRFHAGFSVVVVLYSYVVEYTFVAWSEVKLNKKFVVAEKFVWASFADILKCLWYQEIREMINRRIFKYRIYSCISRPFMTRKSTQKIALDLYTSHTQRPDQAIHEISITIA